LLTDAEAQCITNFVHVFVVLFANRAQR
jgi:hypothetical protein